MDERRLTGGASGKREDRPPGAIPARLGRALLLLAGMAAAALCAPRPAAAQACETLTPACTNQRPHPELTPVTGGYSTPSVSVTVAWTDDHDDLNLATRSVTLNGTNIWSSFTDGPGSATSTATVTLASGTNTIVAHVCDNGTSSSAPLCGDNVAVMTYRPLPASSAYGAALVAPRGAGGDVRVATPGDAVQGYSMPAYTSRGAERAAGLVYVGSQAMGRTSIKVDVNDNSTNAPSMMSIQVRDSATGAWVTSAPTYFLARTGSQILGATWYASNATGVRTYDVVVTSHWLVSRGAPKDTTIEAAALRIHVLHLNEAASPFGAGWTMPGLQRAYVQANGNVMITGGDGSAVLFTASGGSFTAPAGEWSTLTLASGVYTRTWPDGSTATFASTGVLTAIDDRYGSHTAYGYDGSLRLTSITDPAGKVTTLAYYGSSSGNNSNKLYTITDPGGRVATFSYDAGANLAGITDVDGATAFTGTYASSPAHRLLTRTLRGRAWGFAYDAAGLLAADTMPAVVVEGSGVQRPVQRFVTVDGRSTGGTYASPVPRVTASGTDYIDPRGYTTSVTYDGFGQPAFILRPYDYTIFSRDARGLPLRVTESSGAYTSYAWSSAGELLHVHQSASNPTVNTHTDYYPGALFHLDTLVISANAPVHYRYGSHGELLRSWSGTDTTRAAVYTYLSADKYRLSTATDPLGHQTSYAYSGSGFQNLTTVTEPDPLGGTRQTGFGYDSQGRTVTVTTPAGTSTAAFDVFNRQTLAVDPASDSTRFAFPSDSVRTVTDAASKVYTFYQNALGWLTTEVHPDTRSRTYGYDASGNAARRTDRRSQSVTFAYDSANRVKTRTADGITTTYTYGPDTAPWVAAVNSATRDTIYLDKLGRTTEEVSVLAGNRFSRQSQYLKEGPRNALIYSGPGMSGSATVLYGYDNSLRLSSITGAGDYAATTLTYNNDGLPSQVSTPMTYNTALTETLGWGPTHQPTSQSWNVSTVTTALGHLWDYDNLSRVIQRSDAYDTRRRTYGYDVVDRLTGKEDLHSSLGPLVCDDPIDPTTCYRETVWNSDSTAAYPYDRVGNRTDAGTTMVSGTNRYATFHGYTLAYDYEGNLTSKTKTGYSQTYTWNNLGELASVTTNGTTVSYLYDGFGRRVKRTQGSTVNYYVYDGDDLLLETDGSGNVLREYNYYPGGVDQPYSLRVWSGGVGTKYYYTMEYPGHVSGLVNTSRAVVNQYAYTPWGEVESTTEAVSQPLRYMGRELDSTTGLYYVRARWYDPALNRFNSEDPIGLAGGINQYAYAQNSPTNLRDPSGLDGDDPDKCFYTKITIHVLGTVVEVSAASEGCKSGSNPNPSGRGGTGAGTGGTPGGTGGSGGGGTGPGSPSAPSPPPANPPAPSCGSAQFSGNRGTISVQTNSSGYVSWGIYMHSWADNWGGIWTASVYVNGVKQDGKIQNYPPHGSLPPSRAPSGSIFQIDAKHVGPLGVSWSVPNACIVP